MISEETFAKEEARIGEQIHFHDGVWWIKAAPFYYKPVHEFRPFPPKSLKPHPLKALLGHSHQVPENIQATRNVIWNISDGENLRAFSMDRLKSAKRRAIRKGQKDCLIEIYSPSEENLEQMRLINISQASRFVKSGESGNYLRANYYESHKLKWREDMLKIFSHKGHQLVGAFVGDKLVAYIDLIKIEDTWMFGAVKSNDEYLKHRPVDAMYFNILSMAAQDSECKRVVNGGGYDERESLTRFKGEYFLKPVSLPYYSQTLLPLDRLRKLKSRLTHWRHG